jgi:hypothetical protein
LFSNEPPTSEKFRECVETKSDKQGDVKMENKSNIDEAGRVGIRVPSVSEIMGKKHPEKKFKAGSVSATIWLNSGQDSEGKLTQFRTIAFERSYLDKEGNWQSTNSLRLTDIPKGILVLNKAYEYLVLKEDGSTEDD